MKYLVMIILIATVSKVNAQTLAEYSGQKDHFYATLNSNFSKMQNVFNQCLKISDNCTTKGSLILDIDGKGNLTSASFKSVNTSKSCQAVKRCVEYASKKFLSKDYFAFAAPHGGYPVRLEREISYKI